MLEPLPPGPANDDASDSWEQAIVQARSEIRALIESGDLDHDEITAGWVEAWAADLYQNRRRCV